MQRRKLHYNITMEEVRRRRSSSVGQERLPGNHVVQLSKKSFRRSSVECYSTLGRLAGWVGCYYLGSIIVHTLVLFGENISNNNLRGLP